MGKRDEFKESTKRILRERVAGFCSNPGCRVPTTGPHSDSETASTCGEAAHIESASGSGGPRPNPDLSPEERRHINNGIWLCRNCHGRVDRDDVRYPASLLRKWKRQAEALADFNLGIAQESDRFTDLSEQGLALFADAIIGLGHRREHGSQDESSRIAAVPTDELVDLFEAVLIRVENASRKAQKQRSPVSGGSPVLTASQRRILGIVAANEFPILREVYSEIFPDLDWDGELSALIDAQYIEERAGALTVPPQISNRVLSDAEAERQFGVRWVETLRPLRNHYDLAMLLALRLFDLGEREEAFEVLVTGAESCEPGFWNALYRDILTQVKDHAAQELSEELKARVINGLGLCAARDGEHFEALDWFGQLQEIAKQTENRWALDEALINLGVCYAELGRDREAETFYRKALNRADEARDDAFRARVLHNLSALIGHTAPDKAEELVRDSIALKKASDDEVGVAESQVMLSLFAAKRGDYGASVQFAREAAESAEKLGLTQVRLTALINQASSLFNLQRLDEALALYQTAREDAEFAGSPRELRLALQGEARSLADLSEYEQAEAAFEKLFACADSQGMNLAAIAALHDVGICQREQGQLTEARKTWGRAIKRARKAGSTEWLFRCRLANALSWENGHSTKESLKKLRRYANLEARKDEPVVAARLWYAYATKLENTVGDASKVDEAVATAAKLLRKAKAATTDALEAHKDLFAHYKSKGEWDKALRELEQSEQLVRELDEVSEVELVRVIEERAITLQHLLQYGEAEIHHRRALELARSIDDEIGVETSLHNLGELKRKTNRPEEALEFFTEAVENADERGDTESALYFENHRALAFKCLGEFERALRTLQDIECQASEDGFDRERVMAVENMGVTFWEAGDTSRAQVELQRAIDAAHDFPDIRERATVNLARLFRLEGSHSDALKVLAKVEKSCSRSCSYEAAFERAQIHSELGDTDRALVWWERTAKGARKVRDFDAVALAHFSRSHLLLKSGLERKASDELDAALEVEDAPRGRALLLVEKARLQSLGSRDNEEVDAMWKQIQDVLESADDPLLDVRMKALRVLGEHFWPQPRLTYRASKCFATGVVEGFFGGEILQAIEMSTQWAILLFELASEKGSERLSSLRSRIKEWLAKQMSDATDVEIEFFLWPFKAASRMADDLSVFEIDDEEMLLTIVNEEFEAARAAWCGAA